VQIESAEGASRQRRRSAPRVVEGPLEANSQSTLKQNFYFLISFHLFESRNRGPQHRQLKTDRKWTNTHKLNTLNTRTHYVAGSLMINIVINLLLIRLKEKCIQNCPAFREVTDRSIMIQYDTIN